MRIRNNSQRSAAALAAGALLLSFAGTVGLGSAAAAEPVATPTPSSANIDFTKTGSLSLYKYKEAGNTTKGSVTGSPAGIAGLTPISGVGFTLYEVVGIDLTTEAGWDAAGALSSKLTNECTIPAGFTPAVSFGASKAGLTNTDGLVSFSNQTLGAYVVCETTPPKGAITAAKPFLVTLPLPGDTAAQPWIYDVFAYPKNVMTGVTKDVTKVEPSVTDTKVKFDVTVEVPGSTAAMPLTKFWITDKIDSRLTVEDVVVSLGGKTLTTGFTAEVGNDNTLAVKFDEAGLGMLKLNANKNVVVTINATVKGGAAGLGKITNTAHNELGFGNEESSVPSNEVHTNWGGFSILKYAKGSEGATLQGAEFSLFAGTVADGKCQPAKADNTVIASVKTDAHGKASFPALFLGDSDDASKPAATTGCFALVETKAPAGYTLLKDPVAVTVNATATGEFPIITVENTKKAAVELPLTGAAGQVLLTLGGVAAVAIAGGLMLVRRRNQAQAR